MNYEERNIQIKNALSHLKECKCQGAPHAGPFLRLKRGQTFWPTDYCIHLGMNQGIMEPVPYFVVDEKSKEIKGVNPELIKKVMVFLDDTDNLQFLQKARDILY